MKSLPVRRKDEIEMSEMIEHPFDKLNRHMSSLFDGFFRDLGGSSLPVRGFTGEAGLISPKFEVSETEDAFIVSAELPGMEEKDIELAIDQNSLVLKGEKKQDHEEKKKNYFYSERSYGHFHRTMPVPDGVDKSKVKAKFSKGVLKVTLPKNEKEKSEKKRIAISAG